MTITEGQITALVAQVGSRRLDETLLSELKQAFDGIRITHCFDDDIITGKPVHSGEHFSIYLVGGGEHCLTLTNDYAIAAGIVIAEHVDEE